MAYGYTNYPNYMPPYQPVYTGNAPMQPQMTQQASQPAPGPVMRLVASKAEVVAAQIPFDGGEYYFKDTSNGKIYVKAFNPMDGTAPIVTYSREVEQAIQYATLDDLKALRDELMTKPKKAVKKDDADE